MLPVKDRREYANQKLIGMNSGKIYCFSTHGGEVCKLHLFQLETP